MSVQARRSKAPETTSAAVRLVRLLGELGDVPAIVRAVRGDERQDEFAARAGITVAHLSRIEGGKTTPSAKVLSQIANARIGPEHVAPQFVVE